MDIKKLYFYCIFLLIGMANSQTIDSLYEVATWQGFRQGYVSFTFDDNCAYQQIEGIGTKLMWYS